MEPVSPSPNDTLSTEAIAQKTEECLEEMKNLALENPASPPKVLISVGRPGTGKSSCVEDVSGLRGYSQQSLDPVTQKCEFAKVRIEDERCFIMDTPGFDPEHAEAIFQEIVRGIQSIPSTSQIVGFLYFTCINQPRFDSFDRKVLQVVCAMCGHNYIPCVTFITTFWTAEGTSQQANFDTQLRSLKVEWKKAFSVEELHSYKHGRGYHTAGTVAEPFINWFDDSGRNQMAQHARNMIARRYCGPNISRASENTPKIVHELRRGTPIHETEAGRVLGLQPAPRMRSVPTFNQQPQGDPNRQSSSAASSSNAQSDRKDSQDKDFRDIPRTSEDGTQPTQVPERNALQTARQIAMECCHWFFQNVQFNIDIGGPRGNMTPAMRSGYDPLSAIDTFKKYGLDSSKAGRLKYAAEHGIGGQPFSAKWNGSIREDVIQRYRR